MMSPVTGFDVVKEGNTTILVRPEHRDVLVPSLRDGAGLSAGPDAGRGTVQFCDLDDGKAVIREYRRGGFVRHFIKRHYFNDNRALRELRITQDALEHELLVAKPLGVRWEKSGAFYSGAFVTQYVESLHLEDWLSENQSTEERTSILASVGQTFRAMHDLGIIHADLQVRNVLIDSSKQVHLIDFDNARQVPKVSEGVADSNLARFERSMVKRGFDANLMSRIYDGYGTCL